MDKQKLQRLSPREWLFLRNYVLGKTAGECYATINPNVKNLDTAGWRMLRKLRKKGLDEILDAAGLGPARLAIEVEKRLQAKYVKHYQDREVGEYEDNSTRMRATELLADLNKARTQKHELSGPGGSPLMIVFPKEFDLDADADPEAGAGSEDLEEPQEQPPVGGDP